MTSDYAYDEASRIEDIIHSNTGGTLLSLQHQYTSAGVLNQVTDGLGAHAFGYDDTYQLTSVTRPVGYGFANESFGYDDAGNRLTSSLGGASHTYVPNPLNQYGSVDAVSYIYDSN
ncbi:MAG: hypothetical protein GY722_05190, partial [bacterium]|nr:hypothetical protein [bacterium]